MATLYDFADSDQQGVLDTDEYVTCRICGKKYFKGGLGYHISQTHGKNTKEYYDRYVKENSEDKCKCCGSETRFKGSESGYATFCSNSCAMKYNNPMKSNEVVNKMIETNRRLGNYDKASERMKIMWSEGRITPTMIYLRENYPEKYNELCKSISENMKDENNPMKDPKVVNKCIKNRDSGKGLSWEERYGEDVAEKMRNIVTEMMLNDNPMWQEEVAKKAGETRSKLIREGKIKMHAFEKPNKSERFLGEIINAIIPNKFSYNRGNMPICGLFPDFVNLEENMLIELFGCYWHCCKKCKSHVLSEEEIQRVETQDRERVKTFRNNGYKVLVIWEHELENLEELKARLCRWYNE